MIAKPPQIILMLALALGLAACGDDSGPSGTASRPKVVRKAPSAPAPPPAQEKEAPLEEGFADGSAESEEDIAGPLADFDLTQLVVLGVVWNTKNPRALVTDPEGRSFVLKKGSPIGKNNGRVIRIDDDFILVQEKFVDFEGTVSTKNVEMRIRKSQGG